MFQEFDKEVDRLVRYSTTKVEFTDVDEISKIRARLLRIGGKNGEQQRVLQMVIDLLDKSNTAEEFLKLYKDGVPSLELIVKDLSMSRREKKSVAFGETIEKIIKPGRFKGSR